MAFIRGSNQQVDESDPELKRRHLTACPNYLISLKRCCDNETALRLSKEGFKIF